MSACPPVQATCSSCTSSTAAMTWRRTSWPRTPPSRTSTSRPSSTSSSTRPSTSSRSPRRRVRGAGLGALLAPCEGEYCLPPAAGVPQVRHPDGQAHRRAAQVHQADPRRAPRPRREEGEAMPLCCLLCLEEGGVAALLFVSLGGGGAAALLPHSLPLPLPLRRTRR